MTISTLVVLTMFVIGANAVLLSYGICEYRLWFIANTLAAPSTIV